MAEKRPHASCVWYAQTHSSGSKQPHTLCNVYFGFEFAANSIFFFFFENIIRKIAIRETTVWGIVVRRFDVYTHLSGGNILWTLESCAMHCLVSSVRNRRDVVCVMESNGASLSEVTCRQSVVNRVSMWAFAVTMQQRAAEFLEKKKANRVK